MSLFPISKIGFQGGAKQLNIGTHDIKYIQNSYIYRIITVLGPAGGPENFEYLKF